MVSEPAGELEHGFGGDIIAGKAACAFPADFYAGEQIGFGTGEFEQAGRFEPGIFAKDFGIGNEGDRRTAPVGCSAEPLQRPRGCAAREFLRVKLLVAGDFDPRQAGERVDDRDTHTVQAATGGIGLAAEFSARMQRGEDYLER